MKPEKEDDRPYENLLDLEAYRRRIRLEIALAHTELIATPNDYIEATLATETNLGAEIGKYISTTSIQFTVRIDTQYVNNQDSLIQVSIARDGEKIDFTFKFSLAVEVERLSYSTTEPSQKLSAIPASKHAIICLRTIARYFHILY